MTSDDRARIVVRCRRIGEPARTVGSDCRPAPAPFPDRLRSFRVSAHFRDVAKAAANALQGLCVERRSRRRELVVVPRSLLAHFHESGPPQLRQVPRDRGLRQFEDLNEVTHAQFAGLNETQDSETDRVRNARNIRSTWVFAAEGIFA